MIPLRITDPVNLDLVRPAINLQEHLQNHHPLGTKLTSYVYEAAPLVFGPSITWAAKFLLIDGIYYFFAEGELEDLEVGSYVEAMLKGVRLHVDVTSYPMVQFDLGAFLASLSMAEGVAIGLDSVLAKLPGKREFPTGVTAYTIDKAGPNNGTRITVYDIPAGAMPEAFAPHLHRHGEAFYVAEGEVVDEHGRYPKGQLVVVGSNTFHRPTTVGRTVIVVCWTGGISAQPQ